MASALSRVYKLCRAPVDGCTLAQLAITGSVPAIFHFRQVKDRASLLPGSPIVLVHKRTQRMEDGEVALKRISKPVDTSTELHPDYDVFMRTPASYELEAGASALLQVAEVPTPRTTRSQTARKRRPETSDEEPDNAHPAKTPKTTAAKTTATTAAKTTAKTAAKRASPFSKQKKTRKPRAGPPWSGPGPAGIVTPPGWFWHGSLLVTQTPGVKTDGSSKLACFDFDGCLAKTSLFRRGPDAWSVLFPSCQAYLRKLHVQGYTLVIFTNQAAIGKAKATKQKAVDEKIARLSGFAAQMDLPFHVIAATNKDHCRKPGTGMWDFFVEHWNAGVEPDKDQCFFVGDAAGRKRDHGDSDKGFARAVGVQFFTEKEFFQENKHGL